MGCIYVIGPDNDAALLAACCLFVDYFIPLFGLVPKLGPIKDWGLEIENNAILVNNSLDYQTNIKGIYAIGDVNTYPGKLNLILSGFHEAAVMCHSAYNLLNPGKKNTLKYTTISGVEGFDGSKKEAKRKQKTIEVKEIKIRPGINKHDYEVKIKALSKFISGGNKVKVSLRFSGREMEHQNLGMELLKKIIEEVSEYAKVESPPKAEGRQIMMVLVPNSNK